MKVIKRDNRVAEFDATKIIGAILKAFKEVDGEISDYAIAQSGAIAEKIKSVKVGEMYVERIQDIVELALRDSIHRVHVTPPDLPVRDSQLGIAIKDAVNLRYPLLITQSTVVSTFSVPHRGLFLSFNLKHYNNK